MEINDNTIMPPVMPAEVAFDVFYDMVYRLAAARCSGRVQDAEDVASNVFFRYVRYTERHSEPFVSYEHQKAWLLRVTINCSKSLVSNAWNRHKAELTDNVICGMDEDYSYVYEAVISLPIKYRTAVHLYYYEGYKIADIAKLTNTSENTVKSQLKRARELLGKIISEQ